MGAGASVLPNDMGPYREWQYIRWVPFVGVRSFSVARIPPDDVRHLLAPEESSSETDDYDYDYNFNYWDIDDGAVEHWLGNMDEHLT